jgi:hypothetical protein
MTTQRSRRFREKGIHNAAIAGKASRRVSRSGDCAKARKRAKRRPSMVFRDRRVDPNSIFRKDQANGDALPYTGIPRSEAANRCLVAFLLLWKGVKTSSMERVLRRGFGTAREVKTHGAGSSRKHLADVKQAMSADPTTQTKKPGGFRGAWDKDQRIVTGGGKNLLFFLDEYLS